MIALNIGGAMNIDDVKKYFKVKTNVALAEKLNMTPANMTYWSQDGIPYEQQCVLYYESKHKLKPSRNKQK